MSTDMDRRSLIALSGLLGLGAALPAHGQETSRESHEEHMRRMTEIPADAPKTAMLVYPQMIMIDLAVPMTVMKILGARNHLVWKTRDPVATDVGLPVAATHTFDDCPQDIDLLFVPGGIMGTIALMQDEETLSFLRTTAPNARFVTSVCTGSLVLAAAGLLNGYEATSHWGVTDLLPMLGARFVDQRVVEDRNRITGAGATSGMDFALVVADKMFGEEAARRAQLILEYSPRPPFKNGTPAEAGETRMAEARKQRSAMDELAHAAAESAAKRLGL